MSTRLSLCNIFPGAELLFIVNCIINAFQMLSIHINRMHNSDVISRSPIISVTGMRFEMFGFCDHYHVIHDHRFVTECHNDKELMGLLKLASFKCLSHEKRLQDHVNIKASKLLNVNNITRRLKQKKPFELVIL
jgi:hypothetical protein